MGFINISLIILIHSYYQTFGEEAEDGFTYLGYDLGHGMLFIGGEIAEHIGNNISVTDFSRAFNCGWSADAYSDTRKILASKLSDDRFNPFMSTGAAALADADFAQGEVKVITDDQEVIEGDIEPLYQPAN